MHGSNRKYPLIGSALLAFLLTGCGGGGGDSSSDAPPPSQAPTPTPPTVSADEWVQGQFLSQGEFKNQCEVPRTGIDPFSNEAFPDVAGSAFDEKMWLRSWTYETYLWFDEVPDNNPDDFSLPAYFAQLRTNELTDSGLPRDNFHFSQSTEEYNQRTQSGITSGYGISWEFTRTTTPRNLRVRYTEPNSNAAISGLQRGARLIGIDGIDVVNTLSNQDVDLINDALFPDSVGESYVFTFANTDGSQVDMTLVSQNVAISPVQNVRVLQTEVGKVGYMQFNSFIEVAQPDLISAFSRFANENVSELVLDLRYNGGGSLLLASQIAYMVAGQAQTSNRVFQQIIQNPKLPTSDPFPFYGVEIDYEEGRLTNRRLPSPNLSRVYILTTGNSCSASESLINGLLGIDIEVVLIGGTTCGKPFGFFPEDNCGTTYFTIQLQTANEKGFGDYVEGFRPAISPLFSDQVLGCDLPDDLSQPLGNSEEGLLSAALNFMQNGTCPEASVSQTLEDPLFDSQAIGPAIYSPNVIYEAIIGDDMRQPVNDSGEQ